MLPCLFIAITLLSLVLFWYGTGRNKKVLLFSVLWLLIVGTVAYSGYFENTQTQPPRFLFVLSGVLLLAVCAYKTVDRTKLNQNALLAIHVLRLPVELTLYELFLQRQVPVLMTFKGWNFDIVIGVSALFLLTYPYITKKKLPATLMRWWNVLGLFFLTTIVVIALLSAPLPLQQLAFDQPNVAVLQFPYVFLPAYIVPVVYLSHILALQSRRN